MAPKLSGTATISLPNGTEIVIDGSEFGYEDGARRNLGDGDYQDEALLIAWLDAGDLELPFEQVEVQAVRFKDGHWQIHSVVVTPSAAGVSIEDNLEIAFEGEHA